MQRAIDRISQAVATVVAADEASHQTGQAAPPLPASEGPESLRALANLARVIGDAPTMADLSSLIWSHVHHVVPTASCAFFIADSATDSVKVTFAAGSAASILQGLEITVGERLTGWVAGNRQPIINSEARLDLGSEAALFELNCCLALPLVADGVVTGVLSLYNSEPFREDQAQTLQFVMPHLGQMFRSLKARVDAAAAPIPERQPLRIVARQ